MYCHSLCFVPLSCAAIQAREIVSAIPERFGRHGLLHSLLDPSVQAHGAVLQPVSCGRALAFGANELSVSLLPADDTDSLIQVESQYRAPRHRDGVLLCLVPWASHAARDPDTARLCHGAIRFRLPALAHARVLDYDVRLEPLTK